MTAVDAKLLDLEREADAKHTVEWDDPRPWPTLHPLALHGVAGDIVRAIEAETEADPAAMLATLLVGFGNAAGSEPHARVQDDLHPARLFVAVVGETSSGAKGMSWSSTSPFLRAADGVWLERCRKSGFGSGEAIIAELSGTFRDKDSEDPIERRAFVIEPEFARLLTVNARDGSTSSPILRSAWDDGRLELRHVNARRVALGAHLSLLAHITPEELREKLGSIEVASGFANRCLFVLSRRTRKLPTGGNIEPSVVQAFARKLNAALGAAREIKVMRRDDAAEKAWATLYHAEPDREGIVGAVCDRWQAQKLRLSVTYALLDSSAVIRVEHVVAAEALWRYCVASVEWIFGGASGNGVADRLLDELRAVYPEGLTGAEQSALFGRHASEARLRDARQSLVRRKLARIETQPTKGRPVSRAYAVPREKSELSEEGAEEDDLASLLSLHSRTLAVTVLE